MNKPIFLFICLSSLLVLTSCENLKTESKNESENDTNGVNFLTDYEPLYADGDVNAVIEVPAGTLDKWELNKLTGQIEWELVDEKPRIVNYIGYPGNYGMIPQTILAKEKGGDGDPLDILVLGPPAKRGGILKCKIIGVLYLMDQGEQDDKLIAVSANSPLYTVNDLSDLNENYAGISEIIKLWFTNYKGPDRIVSKGFGDKNVAENLLQEAIKEFHEYKAQRNNQLLQGKF